MEKSEFKAKMQKILDSGDIEYRHQEADDLMLKVLESMGYDLSDFKGADKWYA